MKRRAFTLIEMLIATVLAALLLTANLVVLSRLSKDRALIAQKSAQQEHSQQLKELLSWDLSQAETLETTTADQITWTGHDGIDRATLEPNQRYVRVRYRIENIEGTRRLTREQEYLDDPARPMRWREWLADDVQSISLAHSDRGSASITVTFSATSITANWR